MEKDRYRCKVVGLDLKSLGSFRFGGFYIFLMLKMRLYIKSKGRGGRVGDLNRVKV